MNHKPNNDNKRGVITIMAERKYNNITEEQHRLLEQRRDRTLHRLSLDPTKVHLARNRPDEGSCNIIELNQRRWPTTN